MERHDTWPQDLDYAPLRADASAHALRRPFLLQPLGGKSKARVGVLLVHGFSGTPFEMRPLGEALSERGYTVYGPRLSGHGLTSAALSDSTFDDWVASVDDAFDLLRSRVDRVCVCGESLGGLLSLDLARRRGPSQVSAIQVLAAPLWLTPAAEVAIAITRRLGRTPRLTIPKFKGSDIADPLMRQRNNLAQGAVGLPIPAVMSLATFIAHVRAGLREIKVPALLAHSRQDHTAPYACMATLASEIGSPSVETITLERSFHVLPLDLDRATIIDAVFAHVAAHTQ